MKILKFEILEKGRSATIKITQNDTILGLVCSVLSALKISDGLPFELLINDEEYCWNSKKIGTKLKTIKFSNKCNIILRIENEHFVIKYLDSEYELNNKIFSYPLVEGIDDQIHGMTFDIYFHATYWDLKFRYGKQISEKIKIMK